MRFRLTYIEMPEDVFRCYNNFRANLERIFLKCMKSNLHLWSHEFPEHSSKSFWLTWLKPLSLQMWSIGHQRTASTSCDPVLMLLMNPMWRRLPSSLARLLFSRYSLVCLYSFVLEGSTGELFLRCCLLVSSTCVLSMSISFCLSRTSADSWSVAFHNSLLLILSYHLIPRILLSKKFYSILKCFRIGKLSDFGPPTCIFYTVHNSLNKFRCSLP